MAEQTYVSQGQPTVGTQQAQPISIRDISKGRVANTALGNGLVPINSVQNVINVDFDQIIGQGVVRPGSEVLDTTVAPNTSCLGIDEFVANGGTLNDIVAAFPGFTSGGFPTAAAIYYYNGVWNTSNLTYLDNASPVNFAELGNTIFEANGVQPMMSSVDANIWTTNNCIVPTQTLTLNNVVGPFLVGDIVTGNVSGATGLVIAVGSTPNSAANINSPQTNLVLINITGAFEIGDTNITGSLSTATGSFVGITPQTIVIPFLILTASNLMIAAAVTPNRDRIYFSSEYDPTMNPFLTWNTDPTQGDWIDLDPDNGQNITAFLNLSNQVIVFKSGTMYRLAVITSTVGADYVCDIGCVSQKAVTSCQGLGYFYSGDAIYSTDSTAPQQLSRTGVQDFLDAIPLANKPNVALSADENNVYASIGTVTVANQVYENVVLKFSVRDQNWSIRSYKKQFLVGTEYTLPAGRYVFWGTDLGDVTQMDIGTTDDGTPIFYLLDTQELDGGNRSHVKGVNDELIVYSRYGQTSSLLQSTDGEDFKPIKGNLNKRVNVLNNVELEFRFITFRWTGNSSGQAPIFEGIQIEDVLDTGTQARSQK